MAYTTKLFTDHSTTKKEKLNILSRFDEVNSLKESKSLYKQILSLPMYPGITKQEQDLVIKNILF